MTMRLLTIPALTLALVASMGKQSPGERGLDAALRRQDARRLEGQRRQGRVQASRTGPSSARPSRAARTPSSARGTTRTSCSNWRSGATPGSTPASRSAATSTARTTRPQARRGRGLRPAVRGRPQGDGHGGPVLRRGAAGQVAGRDQARGEGRLRGRRLEPLPDRRAGQPLPLVGQRGRRQRLHRRRGQGRLHRPPGPRHPQGPGAVSGPLAERPHPGVEAGGAGAAGPQRGPARSCASRPDRSGRRPRPGAGTGATRWRPRGSSTARRRSNCPGSPRRSTRAGPGWSSCGSSRRS